MTLFDPAGIKERLDELNFIAEKPDFWSDQNAAQKLLREQKTLEKKLSSYQRLVSGIEDIELTIELAESEDDAELAASVIADYDSLEAEIESLRPTEEQKKRSEEMTLVLADRVKNTRTAV